MLPLAVPSLQQLSQVEGTRVCKHRITGPFNGIMAPMSWQSFPMVGYLVRSV